MQSTACFCDFSCRCFDWLSREMLRLVQTEVTALHRLRLSCLYADNCLSLISNFRRVLNAVCFLLANFPASEFYMPTFRNTLFHLRRAGRCEEWLGLRNVGVFIREKVWLKNSQSHWLISRSLNFICRRFETLCLFHLRRQVGVKND